MFSIISQLLFPYHATLVIKQIPFYSRVLGVMIEDDGGRSHHTNVLDYDTISRDSNTHVLLVLESSYNASSATPKGVNSLFIQPYE